ncbi:DUF3471 domain-containing protein [Methylobacterium sp. 13MFTsu3.1M2]|uniref:DUF3471 domain-containing protein n=1 Tax=Methylobacterium sp. 13MFTsu3.1M2 TaxID=1502776 RepID=UPI0008EB19E8|nr:DUF3471 domain-containing protein [Methylobacterium sp. 13MFTsu3.1M2]SFE10156.1 protein of unknown function [Methylobacterium sp. 13MFTsu3.1M2]
MADPILPRAGQARTLPNRPNLEHLRNEAKAHLKTLRASVPTAKLAAAQRDVARDYGFASWRRLRAEVEKRTGQTDPGSPADKVRRLKAEQALPRTPVPMDPAELDQFVGFYQFGQNRIFTVERDEDGLMARLSGQMFYSLLPENPTKFFYKNSLIHAQLSFLEDDHGAVTSLVLHQNGLEQTASRISKDQAELIERESEARRAANKPKPGSEEALRRMITATRLGVPEPDFMSEGLINYFTEQSSDNKRALKAWGDVRSIKFIGVSGAGDLDVYRVSFAQAETEWRLRVTDTAMVEDATVRIVP